MPLGQRSMHRFRLGLAKPSPHGKSFSMPHGLRYTRLLRLGLVLILLSVVASAARAGFESWRIDEVYSNADGSRQFVVLRESQGLNGMNNLAGQVMASASDAPTRSPAWRSTWPPRPPASPTPP